MFRPAHCSLYPLCSQKKERIKNSFLFFFPLHAFSVASIMSNTLWPHGLYPTRLLCPWDSPGKKTGVGCLFSSPGYLAHSGIESMSPALAGRFFIGWATREALFIPSPCNKFNQVIHRQENEDRMVHLYTAKLPSPESEQNNASDNSMDG